MSLLSRLRRAVQWRVDHWSILTSGWRDDVPRLKQDGTKNYEFAVVHVHCESTIWYVRLLEWLAFDCGLAFCSWLGHHRMPRFLREWERAWDEDEPNEIYKLEDWYGDEWSNIWCAHVEHPVLQWVWSLKKGDYINMIELTPAEAKEAFKHHPDKLEWVWKSMEESKQWHAEEDAKEKQQEKASD